ncbi:MAG: glycosyltransferase [Coxiellaceae bacterium]|nr:glycosyltransferase [Coxiellaceae bacterium]
MHNTTLHIIEPTLASEAGHCFAYVNSLLHERQSNVELWINKHGVPLFKNSTVKCHGHFSRRLRKLQQFFLYRKLLKTNDTLFIPTAGRIDMVMLDKHLNKRPSASRVVLHFHQFSKSTSKLAMLHDFAKRHPKWVILATTERLANVFRQAGFQQVMAVACPIFSPPEKPLQTQSFRYALYAGATRADKGFSQVVQAILADKSATPFHLQLSPPESGRYDDSSKTALQQLKHHDTDHISATNNTLQRQEYLEQFNGSICLQPYDADSYQDKFSGVTLDAICCGAPVITTADTAAADLVNHYQAGVVIADRQPETILHAIHTIKNDYQRYQDNCLAAREQLVEQHHPKHTVALL